MMDQQIPERRLSHEARARRRTDLMEAITADDTRTRRWLAPVAAAAVVAGLVGGGYAATQLGGDGASDRRPDRELAAAGSGTGSPTGTPSPTADPEGVNCGASADPAGELEDMVQREAWRDPVVGPVLESYRDIVARHLDPIGAHLQKRVTGMQSSGWASCGFSALGTKLGWSVAGEDGLGMIEVEVAQSWNNNGVRMYFDDWREVVVHDVPGVAEARVAEDGGRFAVVVVRTDGLAVGVMADPLFGNNSLTPIAGFDLTVDDLVATAADPEFALP